MNHGTIFFSAPTNSTFVAQDIEKLSSDYFVIANSLPWTIKWKIVFCWIIQVWFLIRNIKKIDIFISSFAGYHSIFPIIFAKLTSKPSFIILNGTESVGIKELSYGSLLRWPLRHFIYYSFKWSTELWPVSRYLIKGESFFLKTQLKYGVRETFPYLILDYVDIPNGINTAFWQVSRSISEFENLSFITVISGRSQFDLKGIDLILDTAIILPHLSFTIVGMETPSDIKKTSNVTFISKVDRSELIKIYAEHNVYLQLSSFEGFGVSLAEAMSCGLIPIGSKVNAIPDIIGDSGLIVEKKEVVQLLSNIQILEKEDAAFLYQRSLRASQRIVSNYTIEKRIQLMNDRIRMYL